MSDNIKPGSAEWYDHFCEQIGILGNVLSLPPYVIGFSKSLWLDCVNVGRSPLGLVVDCVYICARLSGHGVTIPTIKKTAKRLWSRSIQVLPLDARYQSRRWVWDKKPTILEMFPDELAWDDFVTGWKGNIVDKADYEEE